MSQANVEIVRRLWDAWNAGDVDALLDAIAPETEFRPLRSQLEGDPYVGPEGIRRFMRDAAEEWEYLRVRCDELRDVGDLVVTLGHFDARGRGSGMDVRFPVGWVARLRDGKIMELWTYSDQQEALAAAGLAE